MGVVIACLAAVGVGAWMALRWGHLGVVVPWAGVDPRPAPALQAIWWMALITISGVVSGIFAAGPGGRLAMRLLAATAGDRAQGRTTEADEIVGRITVGGSIFFVLFVGLGVGLVSSVVFFAIRRWLPRERLGALVFAGLLLVVFATRIDPLRADNPDFAIVGPSWVALVVFAALALFHALVLAAVAGRLSRGLPLADGGIRLLPYAPLLLLLLTGTGALAIAAVAVAVSALAYVPAVRRAWSSGAVLVAGRVALAALVLVALPSAIRSFADIYAL